MSMPKKPLTIEKQLRDFLMSDEGFISLEEFKKEIDKKFGNKKKNVGKSS